MGIGDKLLDTSYKPEENISDFGVYTSFKKVVKCPVQFTEDPFEYIEGYLGYKLRPFQRDVIEDLYSVDENNFPQYDVSVLILGMRSGKSLISSTVGSFQLHKLLAMDDPAKQLGQIPHYKLSGCFVANSEQQSKQTAYASFENILNSTDWWEKYIRYLQDRESNEGRETLFQQSQKKVYFKEKNLEILSLHSNSSSLAGVTSFFYSFEEISRADISDDTVQSQTEKRTAQAIYYTGSRSAKSLYPYSKIVVSTSPMYENDFGMQLLYQAKTFKGGKNKYALDALRSKYFPEKVDRMIAYNYTTTEANPRTEDNPTGFTDSSFTSERLANLTAYMRDFEALPPSALSPFFEHVDRIEKCINKNKPIVATFTTGVFEDSVATLKGLESRLYVGKQIHVALSDKMRKYFVCCDQGEAKDAFVICMGHAEEVTVTSRDGLGKDISMTKHKIIIDLIEAWEPDKENKITVSFQNVEEVLKVLNKHFYIDTIAYDQWQSTESIQRLFSEGIHTEKLGATMEMYDILKMLIYSDMIELPEGDEVIQELRTLNAIKGKRIDHPVGGCFTGDTRIKLLNGTTPTFKELADLGVENNFWVYSCLPDGTIIPAKAYNAHQTKSVNDLCIIELDNGEQIKCTPDHLFMLRNGEYKQAQHLKENESLMPLYLQSYVQKYKNGGKGYYLKLKNNKTKKWNYVHRYIMTILGHIIEKDEVIHHININGLDNTPENLEKMTREEHSKRHILMNAIIHSKENIEKRIKTFKENYKNNTKLKELKSKNAKQQYIDNPELIEISRQNIKYAHTDISRKKQRISINEKINTDSAYRELLLKQLQDISVETLQQNAFNVNNGYWKSEEGKKRRKELSKTQLREAAKKRTPESFDKIIKTRIKNQDEKALLKFKLIEDIVISYSHIQTLIGGHENTWRRRLPDFDFNKNIDKLKNIPLNEILSSLKLSKTALTKYLKRANRLDIIGAINHKVKSVSFIKEKQDVYDLTVPVYGNFALDSGVFVHNSKDRADALCRVVFKVYTDSIKDVMQGTDMMPKTALFLSARNLQGPQFNLMSYGGSLAGSGGGIWGEGNVFGSRDTFVQGNVLPNLDRLK